MYKKSLNAISLQLITTGVWSIKHWENLLWYLSETWRCCEDQWPAGGLEMVQERGEKQVSAGHAGYSWRNESLGSFPAPLVQLCSKILVLSVTQRGFSQKCRVLWKEQIYFSFFFSCSSDGFFPTLTSLLFLNLV